MPNKTAYFGRWACRNIRNELGLVVALTSSTTFYAVFVIFMSDTSTSLKALPAYLKDQCDDDSFDRFSH